MKRIISLIVCLVIIASVGCITVSAAGAGVTPRYNNLEYTQATFNIDSNGNANIVVGYSGYQGITTGARITILLEKRNLLVFWKDIQEWVITSDQYRATFLRSSTVSSGTYRVTVRFEISGTGGATDVYETEIKDSY